LEDIDFSRLMKAINLLGLDRNWVLGAIALCAQEIAIKKKLESLGATPGNRNFQEVAELLADRIKQMGEKPPDILLSLARAYPSTRGKLVHWGYKSKLYDAEVKSIVENTIGLIETLFVEMPAKTDTHRLAETFLRLGDNEFMLEISKLDSTQRGKVVFALIERYLLLDSDQPRYREMVGMIRQRVKLVIKSLKPEDTATLLDAIIQRFASTVPSFIMEVLGEVSMLSSVRDMLREKNYTNWIVSRFVASRSFDEAGVNARVVANIGPILSDSQVEQIFQAILENDQIRYSWKAQSSLADFITLYSKKVKPDLLSRVQEEFPPKG